MAARFHGTLKVIALNENDIWRQRYEFNKQMQDLHMIWLCSQRHIRKIMRDSLFQNIIFIGLTVSQEENAFLITM
jgi:hypothetical protein